MVYEAPEAKIFCFAPVENIANGWNWALEDGDGFGTGSEFDLTFPTNEEGDPNS